MTCIAGVVSNGKVWIGGDSAGVNSDGHLQLRRDSKVFQNGEYLIGVSGSWRVNQILRFSPLPAFVAGYDPFQLMAQDFMLSLKKRLLDCPELDFDLLVGFRGRLFHIYGTSQVSEEIAGYEACGSGAQVARGAMFACEDIGAPAVNLVRIGLEAAERFCSGVRGPFTILSI